jgi:peptide deformylase
MELAQLANDMLHLIKQPRTRGIGLAANQIGITKRFFVMITAAGKDLVCVNPLVYPQLGHSLTLQVYGNEGCLSLPGVTGQVLRYKDITLRYKDVWTGENRVVDLSGLDARCAQHEVEHLDGNNFTKTMSRQQRRSAEGQWKKERPKALAAGLGV